MKARKLYLFVVLAVVLFNSCSSYMNELSKPPDVQLDKTKSVTVLANDYIAFYDFYDFYGMFKSKREFVNDYITSFAEQLRKRKVFSEIKTDKTQWQLITFISKEEQQKADSLLANVGTDYLIYLSEFSISVRKKTAATSTINGNGVDVREIKICYITAHFVVYDVKAHKKILDYLSPGAEQLSLLFQKNSVTSAMYESTKFSAKYLKK